MASALHHLFSQHQRLMRMVEEGAKGYKKKVEGLTQVRCGCVGGWMGVEGGCGAVQQHQPAHPSLIRLPSLPNPLKQAVGDTARRGPGRPPGASSLAPAGVVPLDKRVPAFSLGCLGKLLDAVADDGFKLPEVIVFLFSL